MSPKSAIAAVLGVLVPIAVAHAQLPNTAFYGRAFQPNAFSFADRTGVEAGVVVTSDVVTLKGVGTRAVTATCSGCTLSRNGGTSWAASVTGFRSGDRLQLRATSSATNGGVTTATVRVGAIASAWTVTTVAITFRWSTGDWSACPLNTWARGSTSACSVSCGGGTQTLNYTCPSSTNTQTRTVVCLKSDGSQVSDASCAGAGTKPATSQGCSQTSCSGSNPTTTQSCNTHECDPCSGNNCDPSCKYSCDFGACPATPRSSVQWGPQTNSPFNAGNSSSGYSWAGSMYCWTTKPGCSRSCP